MRISITQTALMASTGAAIGAGIPYTIGVGSALCGATMVGSMPVIYFGVKKITPCINDTKHKTAAAALAILFTYGCFGFEAAATTFFVISFTACPIFIGALIMIKIYTSTRHILSS